MRNPSPEWEETTSSGGTPHGLVQALGPQGSGAWMGPPDSAYLQLQIPVDDPHRTCWLIAPRETAIFYGWADVFPRWMPRVVAVADRHTFVRDPGRRGCLARKPGLRIRISRSERRKGYPAGMTNQFRVSRSCTNFELAQIAHHTSVDWHWMEMINGGRRSRGTWEEMFQVRTLSA